MTEETQLRKQKDGSYQYREGYFMSMENLLQLVRDFQADCFDGFVSNDRAYIEKWIKMAISTANMNSVLPSRKTSTPLVIGPLACCAKHGV